MEGLFDSKHVNPLGEFEDVEGMICIVRADCLTAEYRMPPFQIVRAMGGFGTKRGKIGTAFFVKFLIDGEKTRFERGHIAGVLKEEFFVEAEKLLFIGEGTLIRRKEAE